MKTQIIQMQDHRFMVMFKRHWWSLNWELPEKRFLSKKNAEAYLERLKFKVKHPKRYSRMLSKYEKTKSPKTPIYE